MSTHSIAVLPVSQGAYNEIKDRLLAAGYDHTLRGEGEQIDMDGLAIRGEGMPDTPIRELTVTSLYGQRLHEGRVQISCQSKDFTIQMSIAEARDFALNILGGAARAETDQVFATWCRETMKMDERMIAVALHSMRNAT